MGIVSKIELFLYAETEILKKKKNAKCKKEQSKLKRNKSYMKVFLMLEFALLGS